MRNAKIDSNHTQVVRALRDIGCSVQGLQTMGKGVPDLPCGYHGKNILLEVKDGSLPPSKRSLTNDEADWHARWGGQVTIVGSPEEAQKVVIALCVGARGTSPVERRTEILAEPSK